MTRTTDTDQTEWTHLPAPAQGAYIYGIDEEHGLYRTDVCALRVSARGILEAADVRGRWHRLGVPPRDRSGDDEEGQIVTLHIGPDPVYAD